jgi:hypothetical protein
MSEQTRARLLLARFHGDTQPSIVAAIDETVWDHWDSEDEADWRKTAQRMWGMDPTDCEWSEVWAVFSPRDLVEAFATPSVAAGVVADSESS